MRSMSAICLLNAIAMATPAPETSPVPVVRGQSAPAAEPPATEKSARIIHDQVKIGNDIVITAKLFAYDEDVRDSVQSITREVAFDKPLARYNDPICFEISGLKGDYLKIVRDRMILDAQNNGIKTDKENCKVNVAIIFTDNIRKEAENIFRKTPQFFDSYSLKEIGKIIHDTGSVKIIQSIVTKSRDGEPIRGGVIKSSDASMISLPIRRDIISSIALLEIRSIAGLSLTQIADYLAFRTLTNSTDPKIFKGISITELFLKADAGKMPQELTRFDKNYLSTLYSGSGNVRSVIKTGQITRNAITAPK